MPQRVFSVCQRTRRMRMCKSREGQGGSVQGKVREVVYKGRSGR